MAEVSDLVDFDSMYYLPDNPPIGAACMLSRGAIFRMNLVLKDNSKEAVVLERRYLRNVFYILQKSIENYKKESVKPLVDYVSIARNEIKALEITDQIASEYLRSFLKTV